MKLKEILEKEKGIIDESIKARWRFRAKFNYSDSLIIWQAIGDRIIKSTKGNNHKYIIDENTRPIVSEVIKWAIMDYSCKLELNKGILILGNIGSGKTLIMRIFVEFMRYSEKIIATYSAIEIVDIFKSGAYRDRLFISPLFIDDIGTEQVEIVNYGTKEMPLHDIISRRYLNNRLMMFATSNLSASKINERYGDRIKDRFKDMFNIIKLKGETRR